MQDINNAFDTLPEASIRTYLSNALFVQVPGGHGAHHRPMQTSLNDSIMNGLVNNTNGGVDLDSAALRTIARDVIAPSAQSQGTVAIANGWDTPRMAVFLEFTVMTPFGNHREVFSGYTDYVGVINGTVVDPNMLIMLNSHMRINDQIQTGAHGQQTHSIINANSQILNPTELNMHGTPVMTAACSRPTDALQSIQTNNSVGGGVTIDYRRHLQAAGVASHRKNALSASYLSDVLSTYSHAMAGDDAAYQADSFNYGKAANYAKETALTNHSIFKSLIERTQYGETGIITYGELIRLFEANEDNIEVSLLPPGALTNTSDFNNHWGGADLETNLAFSLTHAVPAAMTQAMAIRYEFEATNMTATGETTVVTLPGTTAMFQGMDQYQMAKRIENALRMDILPELTVNRMGSFHIHMACNLLANSQIAISIDGKPAVPFNAANYCDSITSPMNAVGQQDTAMLGNDLQLILQNVVQDANSTNYGNIHY